jgi:hypothetical protein
MKNATATSHGSSRLLEVDSEGEEAPMSCVPKLAQAPRWIRGARPILRYHDAPPRAVEHAHRGA